MDEADTKLNEAADCLTKAAGVFEHASLHFLPRWINLPSSRPPEILGDYVKALSELAMAEAHYMAVKKGHLKGMSKGTLAKLLLYTSECLNRGHQLVSGLKSDYLDIAADLRDFLDRGSRVFKGIAIFHLADDYYDKSKNGIAVALIDEAYKLLQPCVGVCERHVKRLIDEYLEDITLKRTK